MIKKIWEKVIYLSRGTKYHKYFFPSFWHHLLFSTHNKFQSVNNPVNFLTAIPNRGAGIGHQMSNYHSGIWYAVFFKMKHAHIPFAQKSWDSFLGYGKDELTLPKLKQLGYKVVRLPLFDENSTEDIKLIKGIIESYSNKKSIFVLEQDQSFYDQKLVIPYIQEKFYSNIVRESDLTPFASNNYNIAIHVRRGDIVIGQVNKDPNLTMRWLDNEYFEKVLEQILNNIKTPKEIHIYIFSQGVKSDFDAFNKYENVHFYLDLNPESTFLSFCYADCLITSKSSFSYKPALLNRNGIKICPRNFWHSYPDDKNWVLVEDTGIIPENEIKKII